MLGETSLSVRHEKGSSPFPMDFDEIIVIEYGKVKTTKSRLLFSFTVFICCTTNYAISENKSSYSKLSRNLPKYERNFLLCVPIWKLLTSIWIFSSWNPGKRLCQKLADRCGFCGFWTDYCATDMRIVLFTIEPSNIPPYLPPQT